ncbi:hypothetical protein EV361DRAFT_957022, partial [Lentinula raphanica]
MSLFHFSCPRQEIEAALAYFSANSSSLPSSVHQFYQTLQTQIAAEETSRTTTLLPQTESTHLPTRLQLSQLHTQQHPLLTPSPSPPREYGPQPLREIEGFRRHPSPLPPRSSAPGTQEFNLVEMGDAEPPNAQSISSFSQDFGELSSSCNEIQGSAVSSGNDSQGSALSSSKESQGSADPAGLSVTGGPPGDLVKPGGSSGEVGDIDRVGSSTNSKRKRNQGSEGEEGGGGGTGDIGAKKSKGGKKGKGGKKNNGNGKKSGGGGHSGCSRNGANVQRRTRSQLATSAGADEGLGEGVGDTPGEGMEGSGDSSGEGLNPSDSSFVYSPYRASPSQAVREECALLLLNLSSSPD